MTTLDVIIEDNVTTVDVTMTGGILMASSSLSVIDGYTVKKGAGLSAPTIEVGDLISGWITPTLYAAGRVNTIPVNDISDLDVAVQGEIF